MVDLVHPGRNKQRAISSSGGWKQRSSVGTCPCCTQAVKMVWMETVDARGNVPFNVHKHTLRDASRAHSAR